MSIPIVLRVVATAAALGLALIVVPATANGELPHAAQSSSGDLYVVDGSKRYALKVYAISDADLAALTIIWNNTAGWLPVRPSQPVRIVVANNRTLYLVQNGGAWPLNPDPINDSGLASLNDAGELDGYIPAATGPLPNQSTTPPQELVGSWVMTEATGAGNGSWVGESYRFKKDGSFEHASRFVYGVEMQAYETGAMVVSGSLLRLDVSQCDNTQSQFQQVQPCILESPLFGWRVGKNVLGYRVLVLTAFDGTQTEFRPMAS